MIADTSGAGKLLRYAAIARTISHRLGPLLDVLLAGAKSGNQDLREFAESIKRERLLGATEIVRQVIETGDARPGLDPDHARDLIWTLISPEVYQLLSHERGWTDDEYQEWLARSFVRELLDERRPAGRPH
ncbi:hypothetical protein ABIA32_004952 [Streptacidiphilus sp. MAP12-20]|uniref:hypothetical protein n=1 Tax=Streptacidiphilus sp. MAP12-20 TaxID=3156299 RepID=UPI003511DC50